MPHRQRRPLAAGLGAAAALLGAALLAGCGAGADAAPHTWVPQPSFTGDGAGRPGSSSAAPSDPSGSGGSSGAPGSPGVDPAVVATGLTAPVGLTILPDNTALVGERTTGRILRVQSEPGHPATPVRTIAGISTAGGGGLLDLALSPHYAQDELIYAYITTATDNRIIDFTLTGPVADVFTGIPRGTTDNGGRIAFDDTGHLYVATGDAGQPTLAANPTSLAGKVLRMTDVGRPAAGNPTPNSVVFASGFQVPSGLCYASRQQTMIAIDRDRISAVVAAANYGWPQPPSGVEYVPPLAPVPAVARGASGCAVLQGALYISSLDGQTLLSTLLAGTGSGTTVGSFSAGLTKIYGRLRTVVAASDGALWLTTANKDGHGTPGPTDERVLRILASSLGSTSSPV